MGQIRFVYRCQRRLDGRWTPGFELTLIEDGQIRVLPMMSVADPNLTFATKQAAEAASDVAARDWSNGEPLILEGERGEGVLRPQRATLRGARGARPTDLPIFVRRICTSPTCACLVLIF